ncbi:MAG: LPS export ABC transporter periplasmic protein LptC [Bacteroidaceae bacterium]|nr:LPS export ABC transporter periplasmic protein LptC [Bacteroidaceae bacterium]
MNLRRIIILCSLIAAVGITFSCSSRVEHVAEALKDSDSLLFMHVRGVNTFISDSGVMRYHMVAEEWDIYNGTDGNAPTWNFYKGLLMERYDEKFHIDLYVQSDTAYLHEQRLWELRGRVVVRNIKGDIFRTEELFWDLNKHEMWSYKYIRIVTPERELEGTEFHSNEQMTKYYVNNSVGIFPIEEKEDEDSITSNPSPVSEGSENEKQDKNEDRNKPHAKQMRFLPAPDKR